MFDTSYFEVRALRRRGANLNETLTPEHIREAGVVNYWGAEFDFRTCPAFSEGVIRCARNGSFGFTMQDAEYNDRVCWWMERMRGWKIQPDWIIPTHGTIFALATAMRLLVGRNEHVILLSPSYNRYQQAADRLGLASYTCPLRYLGAGTCQARYVLDFDALEAAMTHPGAKLLVLCNPNNPTGTIFPREALERIAALSRKYGVAVFSDEIFAEITAGDTRVTPYVEVAGKDALAITCTSLGKCMSLTGVNHANILISNPELHQAYRRQRDADHYGSIDPMLYEGLLSAYSPEGAEFVEALNQVICRNINTLTRALESLAGVHVVRPDGTYVLWADFGGLGLPPEELDVFLHEEAMLYGGKGSEFGAGDQFRRYSLAVPPTELEKSIHLLRKAALCRGFLGDFSHRKECI